MGIRRKKAETNRMEKTGGRRLVILALPSFHRLILNISVVHNNIFHNKQLNGNTNSRSKSAPPPRCDVSPRRRHPPSGWTALPWPRLLYHRVFVVVVVHAAAQHRLVDGRRGPVRALRHRAVDVLLPLAAQDLPEGGAHLLVAVGVDDGVHGRVELGEEQEELLVGEDVAAGAEDVEEEDDQAGRPADDEGT